ncbi:MAG: hypothetical protein ACKV2T_19725, partial [Kofleriaceae bacterium]
VQSRSFMRVAVPLAIAVASLAFASHVRAERRDCEVMFVRAPDDVRLVIESWLKAEPRCRGTIELRVVETETGSLYLIAQRADGRIHEREVPDAQSAGVLVASWVADDWTSSPPETEEEGATAPTVAPVTVNPFDGAPGATEVADSLPPSRATRATGRWFSVAPMILAEGHGGVGMRFEMDLAGGRSSKWTLGIAAVGVSSSMALFTTNNAGTLDAMDVRALAVAARTWRLGARWNVRWSVGLGPMYTDGTAVLWARDWTSMGHVYVSAEGVSLAYESSLTLARELFDHRWAVTAGPAVTRISQTLDGYQEAIERHKLELAFMLGARYRL